jgi:pseudaminic acid synthase
MIINNTYIGKEYPVYFIAELSANHNQDINVALKLVEEAAKSGANAIKLQTYTPDTITIDCKTELFKIKGNTFMG